MSATEAGPSSEERELAVAKAVGARRGIHRSNPALGALSNGAIAERVRGMLVPPHAGRDGWWLVGRVVDELEDVEFSVWFLEEARRIGISRRERLPAIASQPGPPSSAADGLRRA